MRNRCLSIALLAPLLTASPAPAQVSLTPATVEPAAWERIALRVVNHSDTAWTVVRVEVPDAVGILGVDAPTGWAARIEAGSDTTAQAIEWTGGRVERAGYREFAFLGRLAGDVRRNELVFPVTLTRDGGAVMRWGRGGAGSAPRILITGTTAVSSWGAFALAGVAFGVAVLAVGLAMRRRES